MKFYFHFCLLLLVTKITIMVKRLHINGKLWFTLCYITHQHSLSLSKGGLGGHLHPHCAVQP